MQVRTVLPALHPNIMVGDSLFAVTSEKTTKVAVGFMEVLKLNTTAAPGETPVAPLAGTVETIEGWATAWRRPASNIIMARIGAIGCGFENPIDELQQPRPDACGVN